MKYFIALILGVLLYAPGPATAITGQDVMEKMSKDQRHGYFSGLVDMAIQIYHVEGQHQKRTCISEWFYENPESGKEWDQILDLFEAYPEKEATAIMYVLLKRQCWKKLKHAEGSTK